MGRAAAIAYAREGADVAINYFPLRSRMRRSNKPYQKEGRKAIAIPGDLREETFLPTDGRSRLQRSWAVRYHYSNAAQQQTNFDSDITTEEFDATIGIPYTSLSGS